MRYTEDEVAFIKENLNLLSNGEIGKRLSPERTALNIAKKINRLGLKRDYYVIDKDLEGELWRPLKGFDRYLISDQGRIRCTSSGRISYGFDSGKGYCYVTLKDDKGHRKDISLHRGVALSFLENPNNKKEVNHINGDKSDNRLINLEWTTPSENVQHAVRTGLKVAIKGVDSANSKLTEEDVLFIVASKESQRSLAKLFNVNRKTIYNVKTGKTYQDITNK